MRCSPPQTQSGRYLGRPRLISSVDFLLSTRLGHDTCRCFSIMLSQEAREYTWNHLVASRVLSRILHHNKTSVDRYCGAELAASELHCRAYRLAESD